MFACDLVYLEYVMIRYQNRCVDADFVSVLMDLFLPILFPRQVTGLSAFNICSSTFVYPSLQTNTLTPRYSVYLSVTQCFEYIVTIAHPSCFPQLVQRLLCCSKFEFLCVSFITSLFLYE